MRGLGLGVAGLLWLAAAAAAQTNADVAVKQGVQASGLASGSAAHALAASGQAALGVSAVPLKASQGVAATAGAASGAAADASARAAASGPLPVTDQTISVIPPDQALKR